jgi:hypothetical protein
MKWLKQFPLYCILFSIYPVLAFMSHNITEDPISMVIRPIIISIMIGLLFFLFGLILFRNPSKAGILSMILILVFFSFGHILQIFDGRYVLNIKIGSIRILGLLAISMLIVSIWLIGKIKYVHPITTRYLTYFSLILLIFPSYQIISYILQESSANTPIPYNNTINQNTSPKTNYPDIYYIILDTYTRQDVLQDDYHYDNKPFLDELRSRGFIIADCSHSNYKFTILSISSSLNMNYLDQLGIQNSEQKFAEATDLIQHSELRSNLNDAGYKFIAFENNYNNTLLPDADIYVKHTNSSLNQLTEGYINPFEEMFIQTTAGISLYRLQLGPISNWITKENFPYSQLEQIQKYQLEQLPKIAKMSGPKFIFLHMNIPHPPFIFKPDGTLQTDPGFYTKAIYEKNTNYKVEGYIDQIKFLNSRIPAIIDSILAASKQDPVIIIQGDHGFEGENRFFILNAYHLPNGLNSQIYPTISPVNSFRIVLNGLFGKDYPLLPDRYFSSEAETRFTFEEEFGIENNCQNK